MKKYIFSILLISLLLVSCSSVGTSNKKSLLNNMGKDGDIIITAKSSFLDFEYSERIDRVSVSYSDESINGIIEGQFSKFIGSIALKSIDTSKLELNYYQPKNGLMVFSSNDAKEYCKELDKQSDYINDIDYSRILEADFAVYCRKPLSDFQNLDKVLILITDDVCSVELIASDESKAKGLFTTIKSSYVSYLNKNRISVDYKELSNNFILLNNTIYINNLEYDGFINNFVEDILYYGR